MPPNWSEKGSQAGLRVEYRPLDTLIPFARNARTHSEEQVSQIAASIREFGF
jgi:ParB-like chromosome segregation protein Spo0J